MKTMNRIGAIAAAAGLIAFIAGCGGKEGSSAAPEAAAGQAPSVLASVFAVVPKPEVIIPIPELRTTVAAGDSVVVEAKVMGVMEPFVENRAIFVVGDEATITTCDLMSEDDHCETPWDACCEDPDKLKAGTATIQVVDQEGKVIRSGIRGINGLTELSRVRVAGEVDKASNGNVLIINARAIDVL